MSSSGAKTPVIFFGNERLAQGLGRIHTVTLQRLLDDDYDIKAIITHNSEGHSRKKRELEVATFATEHGIPLLLPERPADVYDTLQEFHAEVAILSSYGRIIPQKVIDIFPKGIINIHPSLLPKYRGSTPIETAILNGDSETGVSVMELVATMDAGPIFAQQKITLSGTETKLELFEKLAQTGAKLLSESLPGILDGSLKAVSQDESKATFSQKLDKSMSKLDVVNLTTLELERQVRAFAGFPKSKLTLADLDCTVTKVAVSDARITELDQLCKDGKYLVIERLTPPGGKDITAQEFINGHPQTA